MRNTTRTTRYTILAIAMIVTLTNVASAAITVSDITHLQGSRSNRIMGNGIVVGLSGTGDGKHLPSMSMLKQMHEFYGVPVSSLDELKNVKNVAVVAVEAMLSPKGTREGEQIEVTVSSIGSAKSLVGGRLLLTPLMGPNPNDDRIMAMASGPIQLDSKDTLVVGRIAGGALMEQDWIHNNFAFGRELSVYQQRSEVRPLEWIRPNDVYCTFVLDNAHSQLSWSVAVARAINEAESIGALSVGDKMNQIAMAIDARTIVVRVPETELANKTGFVARLESVQLYPPETEASVTINRRAGTIIMDANVEFTPGLVTLDGLTIAQEVPLTKPDATQPRVIDSPYFAFDPQHKESARLSDLITALSFMRVSAQDRITIIEELNKNGQLHATLKVDR